MNVDNYEWENIAMTKNSYELLYYRMNKLVDGIDKFKAINKELNLEYAEFINLRVNQVDNNTIAVTNYTKTDEEFAYDFEFKVRIYPDKNEARVLSYDDGLNSEKYSEDCKSKKFLKLQTFVNQYLLSLLKKSRIKTYEN